MQLLLVVLGVVGARVAREAGGVECEESGLQTMQSDFNNCAVELSYKFEAEREGENEEDALCELISETVGECGQIWERCHSPDEVRRLKDTQLEALMLQHSEVNQEKCQVVVDYLASGRQEANRKGMRCSDGQSLAAQRKFGSCSHVIADETYTKLGEEEYADEQEEGGASGTEEEKAETAKVLCDTLANIGKTCMKELQACFRRDDVERTTTNHLESMKTFLIGIAGDKVAPDGLDSCDAAADIDFGPEEEEGEDGEEDYDYKDYDESEEVSSVAKEEIKAVIQKTLSEEKHEQQQDEPKKSPPPKKLVVKNSGNWSEKNTGSFVLLLAVITFRQLTG